MSSPKDEDSFTALQSTLKASLLSTTRTTNQLAAEDLSFHRSLDPSFAQSLDQQNARLLGLASRLLDNVAQGSDLVGSHTTMKLGDSDELEAKWKGVVDVVDSLLEKADTALDEHTGLIKKGADTAAKESISPGKIQGSPRAWNIMKPQKAFENVPTNDESGAFRPLLTFKPHAILPLKESLGIEKDPHGLSKYDDTLYIPKYARRAKAMERDIDDKFRYQHPYKTEIDQYKYPASLYVQSDPIPALPFETTTATFVDTPEAYALMLAELKTAKEIAIDLEHHDLRSFIGIVSLMQISTRNHDWIVDTLKPWRRKLESLNEVFADPNILKVFHGSAMDMVWLQRDFGLYIVGLFDTERAAVALRYPGRGLAYLLARFVNVQAQKQYQLADWRIRPLPKELLDYARSDTHFLLYIYDCMRNELIEQSDFSDPEHDLLQHVLDGSKGYQLQRYENPIYDAERGMGSMGWYKLLFRNPVPFSKEQFSVFKAVHQWRDEVARQDDDGVHFVMSNQALFNIAKEMPTSRERALGATQSQSAAMKLRRSEMLAVIAKAKRDGATGREMMDVLRELDVIADQMMKNRAVERGKVRSKPGLVPTKKPAVPSSNESQPRMLGKRPTVLDAIVARSGTSKFWGGALVAPTPKRSMPSDVRLNIPLPELTASLFTEAKMPTSQSPAADSGARAEHAYIPAEQRKLAASDDVFVIKELKGRNKQKLKLEKEEVENVDAGISQDSRTVPTESKESNHSQLEDGDDVSSRVPRVSAEDSKRKAERKAVKVAKREASLARKRAHNTDKQVTAELTVDAEAGTEEAPFDYDNAPSVLHAQDSLEHREKRKKNKGRERGIDPYQKALNAPKGMPRAHREKAGKSATFSK